MEVYLWVFVNFEQNNWARLLSMAKFAYNNANNRNTGYTLFELYYGYNPWMLFEKDINHYFSSNLADKLLAELRRLMIICKNNLYCTQKLQKRIHNKSIKSKSYAPNNKDWLNSKVKQNQKLEAKLLKLF